MTTIPRQGWVPGWVPESGDRAVFDLDVKVRVIGDHPEHPGVIYKVAYEVPGAEHHGNVFDADIDELRPDPDVVACPLVKRDPLRSCRGLLAHEVYEHVWHTHLAGTQHNVTSYRTMLDLQARSLRSAAETMRDEGHPGIAEEVGRKAAEFERIIEGLDAAGRAI